MSSVELAADVSTSADRPRHRGAFWRLYSSEVALTLSRRRNQALLAVLAVVPLVIGVAVKVKNPTGSDGPQFLGRITGNGLFLTFTALTVSIPFFLPLVVGVLSGDAIAGEAGSGTLRYLLTVPVTRTRLWASKALSLFTVTGLAVALVAAVGLLTGGALFGLHSVVLLSGDTVGLGNGLVRALLILVYVAIGLYGLAAIGLFISTLTENAIAAMAATVGVAIFFALLDAVPQLSAIHPFLLTDHWLGFGELLRSSVGVADLFRWSGLHLLYAVVFLSLAWSRLNTKDVTA
jgi:ABC-2 type transport system permease protein